jgi:hypothetical protein
MPEGIEVAADIRPVLDLIGAAQAEGERANRLALLRRLAANARSATEQYAEQLRRLYDDAQRPGNGADWLVAAAATVGQRGATERERLYPGIEQLKHQLAASIGRKDPEFRVLFEETIAIGETWLALPASFERRLLQLAAERGAASEKIRPARPVAGEIDYTGLSREHLARHPKIRAALAE